MTRKQIEKRIELFISNIRKGISYDANVVLLRNEIEEYINNKHKQKFEKWKLSGEGTKDKPQGIINLMNLKDNTKVI
jgi:hypothetical protein